MFWPHSLKTGAPDNSTAPYLGWVCSWNEMPAELGIWFSLWEQITVGVWKFLARKHGIPVTKETLYRFFSWTKALGFPMDVKCSLDSRA